jgi:hypothetical protein
MSLGRKVSVGNQLARQRHNTSQVPGADAAALLLYCRYWHICIQAQGLQVAIDAQMSKPMRRQSRLKIAEVGTGGRRHFEDLARAVDY